MKPDDNTKPDADVSDKGPEISRRKVLTGVGAFAAGAALAGTAPAQALNIRDRIGARASGATVGEFVARIEQSGLQGEMFTAVGYLTKLAEAADGDLFSAEPNDVSTALVTLYATGTLQARIAEGNLRVIDVVGDLTIYQRNSPGATFDNVSSFQEGTEVTQFALTLQDVLAIFAPGQGIPTVSGEMSQTGNDPLGSLGRSLGYGGAPFGKLGRCLDYRGTKIRISASGIGTRPDPSTFNTSAEIAGTWTLL